MRYRYIAYKYTRKVNPDAAFQSIWESFGVVPSSSTVIWRPPTDVYETPEELVVLLEIAGVAEEDMAVTLFSDLLVIEGTREQPPASGIHACHRLGIKYGAFRSEVYLPVAVDHDHVRAEYQNGLLRITLKKLR